MLQVLCTPPQKSTRAARAGTGSDRRQRFLPIGQAGLGETPKWLDLRFTGGRLLVVWEPSRRSKRMQGQ